MLIHAFRLLTLLLAALFLVGCQPSAPTSSRTSSGCKVGEFGNGVYFFGCALEFGPALAEFRKTHEVVSVTSYSACDQGTTGSWVVTKLIARAFKAFFLLLGAAAFLAGTLGIADGSPYGDPDTLPIVEAR